MSKRLDAFFSPPPRTTPLRGQNDDEALRRKVWLILREFHISTHTWSELVTIDGAGAIRRLAEARTELE